MSIFSNHEFIDLEGIGDFETAWCAMAACENPASIRKLLQARYRDSYNDTDFNTDQIAACFGMGRRYFQEARSVNLSVKPLLVYYGITNIATGAILIRQPGSTIEQLKQYHGLSFEKTPAANRLGLQGAKVNGGKFFEFNDITRRYDVMTPNGYFGVRADDSAALSKKTFQLEELLCRIPELKYELHFNLGCASRILQGTTERFPETSFRILCQSQLDEDSQSVAELFPELRDYSMTETRVNSLRTILHYRFEDGRPSGDKYLPSFSSVNGNTYFISRLSGCHLSEVAIQFAAAFILSNVVRYLPETWEKTLCAKDNIGYIPVLEKFYRILDRKYPVLVANELFNKKIIVR